MLHPTQFFRLILDRSKAIRIVAASLVFLLLGSCAGPEQAAPQQFSGELAFDLVAEQVQIGPRHPGSAGHGAVQDWIEAELVARGWPVERQPFSHQGVPLANLIARHDGAGDELILLGAHYDTRPVADEEPQPDPGPVLGANDGGSGVAVLLELARTLPRERMSCDVWLVFFDAEDSGRLPGWDWILGSRHFAAELERSPEAVIIVDMVGDQDLQLYRERNSDPALGDQIWATGQRLGYEAFLDQAKYSILDDHTPFLERGIPALDIIDFDYPYWHTLEDTLDKVAPSSLEAVGSTVKVWLEERCMTGLDS